MCSWHLFWAPGLVIRLKSEEILYTEGILFFHWKIVAGQPFRAMDVSMHKRLDAGNDTSVMVVAMDSYKPSSDKSPGTTVTLSHRVRTGEWVASFAAFLSILLTREKYS